jgi:hypothetical protein
MKVSRKREKLILKLKKQSEECESRIKRESLIRSLKKKTRKHQRELDFVKKENK